MPIYSLLKELTENLEDLNILRNSLTTSGIPYITSFEWWDIVHENEEFEHKLVPSLSSKKPFGKVYLTKKELKLVQKLRKETIQAMKEKGLVYEPASIDNKNSLKKSKIVMIVGIDKNDSNIKKVISRLKRAALEKYLFGCIYTISSCDRHFYALFEGRTSSVVKIKKFACRKLNLRFSSINDIRKVRFKRLNHKTFDNMDFAIQYFRNHGEIAILNAISEKVE